MRNNIAIVGAGQLGSRHLQALSVLTVSANIWVVDPSQEALIIAKSRWDEVAGETTQAVQFVTDLRQLPEHLAVAIIATSSLIRRQVVESLLQYTTVRYLVLEKVLFPSLEDYTAISQLVREKDIKAWVNCPRRQYPGYQQLKQDVKGNQLVMTVTGSAWGLACNSIHWVDIFSYLCGDYSIEVLPLLDPQLLASKRQGYIEFSGSLLIQNSTGSRLFLHCFSEGSHPLDACLEFADCSIFIQETKQQLTSRKSSEHWKDKVGDFPVLYQSQLSHLFVSDLLRKGTCSLTSFEESIQLHIPLMRIFLSHYNTYNQTPRNKLCPIT